MKTRSALFFLLFILLFIRQDAWSAQLHSRGLFVSFIQDPAVLSSRARMRQLVDFAKKARVSTIFVQVYRENKTAFPSKTADDSFYRDWSAKISGDPLAVLIREAHGSRIQVHAWMNLLSLGANENAFFLKKYGPEILTRNRRPKNTLADYKIDDQFFLEPGDPRVRRELADLVGELLRRYPALDGIQFDYIRYPDKDPAYGFTKMNMERFKKAARRENIEEGDQVWKEWKKDQVTALLRVLAGKARAMRPGLQVSTTGLMPYSRARLEAFQDWQAWLNTGLVDFVTLMCYSPDVREFERYVRNARANAPDLKKCNLAVGAYALSARPADFERQFEICEEAGSRACVVFHYGSLVDNSSLAAPLTKAPSK